MDFSPMNLSKAFVDPLKYFFKRYAHEPMKYDDDRSKTKIEIGTANDFHKQILEMLPRILVDRGPYQVAGGYLNQDLMTGKSPFDTRGLEDRSNHALITGEISVVIEARNEGTCEVLTDMVVGFLYRAAHLIARDYGFQKLGRPMTVGSCAPFEDGEKQTSFRVVISMPYLVEDAWKIFDESIKIKDVEVAISSSD